MSFYIYKSALSDFLRLKRLFVWLLVALGLFGITKIYLALSSASGSDVYPLLTNLLVFRVLPLAAAIFGTAVLSQEVEQKTIVYMLTRPIARSELILMRTLAAITVVALVTFFSGLAVAVGVFGPSGVVNQYFLRDMISAVVGAAAYCSLFVLISLLINKAMLACLIFAFAWETSVPSMPGSVHYLSITSYLNGIAQRPSVGTLEDAGALGALASVLGKVEMSASTGWIAMAILIGFCTWAMMWWFSRFEYTPREDV